MSPILESKSDHIPAWKKLGLKLKFAKEELDDIFKHQNGFSGDAADKKRKAADSLIEPIAEDRPSKKPKEVRKRSTSVDEPTIRLESYDQPAGSDKVELPLTIPTPKANRKSVTFTPETKSRDGESVKQLYRTWLDQEKSDDPSFDPTITSPALRSVVPATSTSDEAASQLKNSSKVTSKSPKKSKKLKKVKNSENASTSKSTSPPTSPPIEHPVLTYLTTYHISPDTWKFSKPHQNHLLKNLFSLTHLPPSYDPALLKYLRGLQGSARSRIRQQALEIRSQDIEWLSYEPTESEKMDQETDEQCIARRKRDYEAAVTRMKRRLRDAEYEREDREWEISGERKEWERHVRKRRRAELVLWGVGEEEPEEVKENAAPLPKRRALENGSHGKAEPVTIQSRGMGGVAQISQGGIAKGSAGKKIVFGEDENNETVTGAQQIVVDRPMNGEDGKQKRRRRKKTRTGVPDDDDTSSSDSSSSSIDESDAASKEAEKGKKRSGKLVATRDWSESSGSDFSSNEGSDSD